MSKPMSEHQTYRLDETVLVGGLYVPAGTYAGAETWVENDEAEAAERPAPTRHVLKLTRDQHRAAGGDADASRVDLDVTEWVRAGQIEPMID